jgi:glycosyltransferase involved in cell wall biosynthesis
MKVAYLSCDPGVPLIGTGGSSIHVQEMVRALRALGHDVTLYSRNPGSEPQAEGGIRFVPLDGLAGEAMRAMARDTAELDPHLHREISRLYYSEYAKQTLLPFLTADRPDIIYERYSLFSYAGVEIAAALGVPLLLEVNAPLTREASRHRGLVLRETAELLERRIFREADALLAVSEDVAQYARDLGVESERISVVTTGVDIERFRPASGDNVRERHAIASRYVLGFVGSLKPWHDIETVLGALELLITDGVPAHLLVVGDGPQLGLLRSRSDLPITCVGAVPHEEIPAYLAAMDIVVVPYAAGGACYFSPIKLYEAMAMARPVAGARAGQVADVIADGENGVLYEPGEAPDLAAKGRQVFDMPDRGARFGEAARRSVTEHTWEAAAKRVLAIAEGLGAGR